MTQPLLIRVRIVGTDRFVGKRNPTYAFRADEDTRDLSPEAHWYVPESQAKVWTDLTTLRRLLSQSTGRPFYECTFKRFEAVFHDGSSRPLDEVVELPQ